MLPDDSHAALVLVHVADRLGEVGDARLHLLSLRRPDRGTEILAVEVRRGVVNPIANGALHENCSGLSV